MFEKEYADLSSFCSSVQEVLKIPKYHFVYDFPQKASERITAFLDSLHFGSFSLPELADGFLLRSFILHGQRGARLGQNYVDFMSYELWNLGDW